MSTDKYDPKELFRRHPLSPEVLALSNGIAYSEDQATLEILKKFNFVSEDLGDDDAYRVTDIYGNPIPEEFAYIDRGGATFGSDIARLGGRASVLEAIARTIAKGLPEGNRNQGVIAGLDLETLVGELIGKRLEFKVRNNFAPDLTFYETLSAGQANTFINVYKEREAGSRISPMTGVEAESDASVWQRTRGQRRVAEAVVTTEGPEGTTKTLVGGPGGGLQDMVNAGIRAPEMLSEDDLRKIFSQSALTDIRQLEQLLGSLQESAPEVEPTIDFESRMLGATPGIAPGATEQRVGAKLTWRQASQYLINGKASPNQVRTLQRRMVLAGLFDDLQDGYQPGDALDINTNEAYQRLLGEAYRRNMSVDDTLSLLSSERSKRLPSLNNAKNRTLFNMSAQELVGRNLTDVEYEGLVSYLTGLRGSTGMAALGGGSGANAGGFSDVDVTSYLADELQSELKGVTSVNGTMNLFAALKGAVT